MPATELPLWVAVVAALDLTPRRESVHQYTPANDPDAYCERCRGPCRIDAEWPTEGA